MVKRRRMGMEHLDIDPDKMEAAVDLVTDQLVDDLSPQCERALAKVGHPVTGYTVSHCRLAVQGRIYRKWRYEED